MAAAAPAVTTPTFGLTVKPFGKDGVRVLYTGGAAGTVLEVSPHGSAQAAPATTAAGGNGHKDGDNDQQEQPQPPPPPQPAWEVHADAALHEGAIIVKPGGLSAATALAAPRTASWRLRSADGSVSNVVRLVDPSQSAASSSSSSRPAASLAPIKALDDAELAFNVLQWFGTVVVDCRSGGRGGAATTAAATARLRESVLCVDAAAAAALPPKDDAVAIGAPPDVLDALAARARRGVHVLSDSTLAALCAQHPCLLAAAEDSEAAPGTAAAVAVKRPVLPNLVDGALLVGHQGHALCIAQWAAHTRLGRVINLAADHVDPTPAREAARAAGGDAWSVMELRCADGAPLTDKPGDAARFLEVLPKALDAIRAGTAGGRLVFIHCQQGRSRAGSIATAHLLTTHPAWTLFDAVAFLAARRPETEISEDYAHALERWAVGAMGRAPSLTKVRAELPRQLRPSPRGAPPLGAEITELEVVPYIPPPAAVALQATAQHGAGSPTAAAVPTADAASHAVVELEGEAPKVRKPTDVLPPDSPLGRGGFGAAAIRRASPAAR